MATLKNTTIDDTGFVRLPSGTSAQRPGSPTAGMMRFNSSEGYVEVYNGVEWRSSFAQDYVKQGRILDLDASNPASYSGSGTTWNDLSGVMGNVNVQNRTTDWTFTTDTATSQRVLSNSTNRTAGNSPGINIPVNNGYNKVEGTLELWIQPRGDYTGGHGWFNNSDGSTNTNASNWHWIGTWDTSNIIYQRFGNPSLCCNDITISSFQSVYPLNVWQHWVVTWNIAQGRGAYFKNGTQVQTGTYPTNVPNSTPTVTGQMFNGHERPTNMQFKGLCNTYRMYNRELTLSEIQQNYNATRGRFGL